jgi:hypothetical protein
MLWHDAPMILHKYANNKAFMYGAKQLFERARFFQASPPTHRVNEERGPWYLEKGSLN